MLRQEIRRRSGILLGDKQVVSPIENADVVRGHVKEIQEVALLAEEPIGHQSPMSKGDRSRNSETEYDPENRPFPRQVKVSGGKKEKKNQPHCTTLTLRPSTRVAEISQNVEGFEKAAMIVAVNTRTIPTPLISTLAILPNEG